MDCGFTPLIRVGVPIRKTAQEQQRLFRNDVSALASRLPLSPSGNAT
jgi:hypothetical protein